MSIFVGGISGTPTYLINDVIVDADPTWTVADWQKVIDPLLQQPSLDEGKEQNVRLQPSQ